MTRYTTTERIDERTSEPIIIASRGARPPAEIITRSMRGTTPLLHAYYFCALLIMRIGRTICVTLFINKYRLGSPETRCRGADAMIRRSQRVFDMARYNTLYDCPQIMRGIGAEVVLSGPDKKNAK